MSDKTNKNEGSQKPMPTLTIDWESYGHFLDGSDLSDQEKREFVETLWSIVVGFVDLGFSVGSPTPTCGQDADAQASPTSNMVHSLVRHWDKVAHSDKENKDSGLEQSGPRQRGRTP